MATWNDNTPQAKDPICLIDDEIRNVKEYLEEILSVEHVFPGEYGSTAGKHTPGQFGVVKIVDNTGDVDLADNGLCYVKGASLYSKQSSSEFVVAGPVGNFQSGTRAIFRASSAPNGWHIVSDYDEVAVYATKGSDAGQPTGGTERSGSWTSSGWSSTTHSHEDDGYYHTHVLPFGGVNDGVAFRHVSSETTVSFSVGYATDDSLPSLAVSYFETYGYSKEDITFSEYTATPQGYSYWRPPSVYFILCERD